MAKHMFSFYRPMLCLTKELFQSRFKVTRSCTITGFRCLMLPAIEYFEPQD